MIIVIDFFFIIVMICAVIAAIIGVTGKILSFIIGIYQIAKLILIPIAILIAIGCHVYTILQLIHQKEKRWGHFILLVICDIVFLVSIPHISKDIKSHTLEKMNTYSKIAYDCVDNYLSEKESQGITIEEVFAGDDFAESNSYEGFTIYKNIFFWAEGKKKCDYVISNALQSYKEDYNLVVFVGLFTNNNKTEYYVQVKDSRYPNIIGQYPSNISYDDIDKVVWNEYYTLE